MKFLLIVFINYVLRRRKVKVIYKGGGSQVFWCKEFSFSRSGGTSEAEWVSIWPTPLFFNAAEVEAVWQVR